MRSMSMQAYGPIDSTNGVWGALRGSSDLMDVPEQLHDVAGGSSRMDTLCTEE